MGDPGRICGSRGGSGVVARTSKILRTVPYCTQAPEKCVEVVIADNIGSCSDSSLLYHLCFIMANKHKVYAYLFVISG